MLRFDELIFASFDKSNLLLPIKEYVSNLLPK